MKRYNHCGRVINVIEQNILKGIPCEHYAKWCLRCANLLREDELTILSLCFQCQSIVSEKVHDPYEQWTICSTCKHKKICDENTGEKRWME